MIFQSGARRTSALRFRVSDPSLVATCEIFFLFFNQVLKSEFAAKCVIFSGHLYRVKQCRVTEN